MSRAFQSLAKAKKIILKNRTEHGPVRRYLSPTVSDEVAFVLVLGLDWTCIPRCVYSCRLYWTMSR